MSDDSKKIAEIVNKVMQVMSDDISSVTKEDIAKNKTVPIEVSARHVHLSAEHVHMLFGEEATLTPERDLSQTGQFLSRQRVRIIGPKGTIEHVAVLGPERKASQVELSATDCRQLGVSVVLRESGDLAGSSSITLNVGERFVHLSEGAIVARNHIHMNEDDAERLHVKDQMLVDVLTSTQRPLLFKNVIVRVDKSFVLNMHIDFDEANACLCAKGDRGTVIIP